MILENVELRCGCCGGPVVTSPERLSRALCINCLDFIRPIIQEAVLAERREVADLVEGWGKKVAELVRGKGRHDRDSN